MTWRPGTMSFPIIVCVACCNLMTSETASADKETDADVIVRALIRSSLVIDEDNDSRITFNPDEAAVEKLAAIGVPATKAMLTLLHSESGINRLTGIVALTKVYQQRAIMLNLLMLTDFNYAVRRQAARHIETLVPEVKTRIDLVPLRFRVAPKDGRGAKEVQVEFFRWLAKTKPDVLLESMTGERGKQNGEEKEKRG